MQKNQEIIKEFNHFCIIFLEFANFALLIEQFVTNCELKLFQFSYQSITKLTNFN